MKKAKDFFVKYFDARANDGYHNKTTGDGYYESCVIGIEGNQVEITV